MSSRLSEREMSLGGELRVRDFEASDEEEVRRIFNEGMMEMKADTAFRGLRNHPELLLLYGATTVLLPLVLLSVRYCFSRSVVHQNLQRSMDTDMGDMQGFYGNTTGSGLWVAELNGAVVGVVAATPHQGAQGGALELRRMSVDRRYRRCGVGVALGHRVKEFAASRGYSSVVLGTTAYTAAPHRLYRRLGFRRVGVTSGYVCPSTKPNLLQRIFYRVHFHHYVLDLQDNLTPSNRQQ